MARQFGFAADHVRSLTVVTADGSAPVDASTTRIFWAIRAASSASGS